MNTEFLSLHRLRNAELSEVKVELGCGNMSNEDFLRDLRLEGNDAMADRLVFGKKGEIARIYRKYLPSTYSKDEYKNGTKAWLHLRARMNIRYHREHVPTSLILSVRFPENGMAGSITTQIENAPGSTNVYRVRLVNDLCNYLLYRGSTRIPVELKGDIDRVSIRIPDSCLPYVPTEWRSWINTHMANTYMHMSD